MGKLIKWILLLFIGHLTTTIGAQNIIEPGFTRAFITLSPTYTFASNQSYFYIHGGAEIFLDNKISFTGDAFYYAGRISDNNRIIKFNHSLFFGASYHFTKGQRDFYIGLQPGISITQLNAGEHELLKTEPKTNPLLSTMIGYNYYFHKNAHFFVQSRLVIGEHNYNKYYNLSELRLSTGLGFNL